MPIMRTAPVQVTIMHKAYTLTLRCGHVAARVLPNLISPQI